MEGGHLQGCIFCCFDLLNGACETSSVDVAMVKETRVPDRGGNSLTLGRDGTSWFHGPFC